MAFDKRTTLMILSVLMIVAIVGLNFEQFTGQLIAKKEAREAYEVVPSKVYASNDPSIVKMDNPIVRNGKKVYFTIEVGSEGAKRRLAIYRAEGGPRVAQVELDENCGGNKCRPDRVTWADYRAPQSWEGKYCGRAWDYTIKQYTIPGGCFTVL
ncbi:MAG: hypothetical protein KKA79_09335 [Nanoarchaeota archaeon]|nr:hypothetical protein [Nanoarchaeota archaeon]